MRTLELNKTTLWLVEPLELSPVIDKDGFETGEKTATYSAPIEIRISLCPSDGSIVERIFGKDASLNMLAVSNEVKLAKDSLLFCTEPTDNFDKTYDYRVSRISKSVNTFNYGLVART